MSERETSPNGSGRLDSLLRPTLQDGVRAVSIYSVRAGFFVAFLGGPMAAVIFGALNSQRLGRLGKDAWLYAFGGIVFTAFAIGIGYLSATGGFGAGSQEAVREQTRTLRTVSQALGLAFFGLVFLLHRRFYKAAEMAGQESPSPWIPGVAASVVGGAVSLGLVAAGAAIAQ